MTEEPAAPSGVEWIRAGRLLALHRLGPLAASVNHAMNGRLLPPDLAERLEPSYRAVCLRNAFLQGMGATAHRALAESGIPSLRFNGAALIESGVYPDPGARPMDDVDLLVPSGDAAAAVSVLLGLGFVPALDWTPDLPEWLDSITLTASCPSGGPRLALDLHWRTEFGTLRFGRIGGDSPLWDGADVDAGLPAPGPHLVILTEQVLGHIGFRTPLLGLADVGRLIPRVASWQRFLALARARPYARGVGLLLRILEEETSAPVPRRVIHSLVGGGVWIHPLVRAIRPSQLLGSLRPSETRLGRTLARTALLGSPIRAAELVAGTLWPGESWLRARYGEEAIPLLRLRVLYLKEVLRWSLGRGDSPALPRHQEILKVPSP